MQKYHKAAAPHGIVEQASESGFLGRVFVLRLRIARPTVARAHQTDPTVASDIAKGEAQCKEPARRLFLALAAPAAILLALSLAATIGAPAAFAQAEPGGGGGGDAIQQTLTNVRNYLATLSFAVGGIGFVASLLVKGYASINENAHAYAAMGMKGSLWCIVAGVIVTPILSIAAGLAGGA